MFSSSLNSFSKYLNASSYVSSFSKSTSTLLSKLNESIEPPLLNILIYLSTYPSSPANILLAITIADVIPVAYL